MPTSKVLPVVRPKEEGFTTQVHTIGEWRRITAQEIAVPKEAGELLCWKALRWTREEAKEAFEDEPGDVDIENELGID